MIGTFIAGAALLGLPREFGNTAITTVPFTFESRMNPNSPILGTHRTVFVVEWPNVVAIDAGTGKRLWEKSLASHAAVSWRDFNQNDYWQLGAFPIESGGSVAFCFTYSKPDGTIETEVESRRRTDGGLNFIVHVETPPMTPRIVYSPRTKTFERDDKPRSFEYLNRPNVVGLGNQILVVPDPQLNPELFILSAATGAVQSKMRPSFLTPESIVDPSRIESAISFGACLYTHGRLISHADSVYGPASRLIYLGDGILAQYLGESFFGAPSLSDRQGVALFPLWISQDVKMQDLWRGAYMREGALKDWPPR